MRLLSLFLLATVLNAAVFARQTTADSPGPAFSSVPELERGYHLLYEQKFPEARSVFEKWAEEHPDEPFGQASLAASYLFEEFFLQHVLTSDYFLDDKRFLGGITGAPDPQRMKDFEEAVQRARKLAFRRLKARPRDPEGLFALTLCAGMQSDANSMLLKKHYDALKRLKEANANAEMLLHTGRVSGAGRKETLTLLRGSHTT